MAGQTWSKANSSTFADIAILALSGSATEPTGRYNWTSMEGSFSLRLILSKRAANYRQTKQSCSLALDAPYASSGVIPTAAYGKFVAPNDTIPSPR
jgi:hypothetical protein